jgi:hypothetical protein
MKNNTGLVAWAREWLGRPYWYGTCCYACTESLLQSKAKQYPSHYTAARMARYRADIQAKRSCADCIGLIKGYIWEKDGKIVYDADTDMNTGGLFNRARVKGAISRIPEVPGLIVYKDGHVGVYEGGGMVIEAKGFAAGIVRLKLNDTQWTHWIAHPNISYDEYGEELEMVKGSAPYVGTVKTQTGNGAGLWASPEKKMRVALIPDGGTVRVLADPDADGFAWAEYGNNAMTYKGYVDTQYVLPISDERPEDTEDGGMLMVPAAEAVRVAEMLNDLAAQCSGRILEVLKAMKGWGDNG